MEIYRIKENGKVFLIKTDAKRNVFEKVFDEYMKQGVKKGIYYYLKENGIQCVFDEEPIDFNVDVDESNAT